MKGVQLTKLVQELGLHNLTPEIDLSEIVIKTAEINRPALQLTGYLEHFANERVQIIGYVEYTYLMQLSDEERKFKYERFISSKIPCVIFSTMTRPSQDMIDLAVKYNVPTFVTERTTSSFMAEIIRWLGVQLAPCISIHGVLVDVYGEGVLITGESGIGKSEAALELIKRGHRLVTDDVVELRRVSDETLAEFFRYGGLSCSALGRSPPPSAVFKIIVVEGKKKSEPISDLENLVRIICVWCTRQESNLWPSESERCWVRRVFPDIAESF